jgi:hypothetical protein
VRINTADRERFRRICVFPLLGPEFLAGPDSLLGPACWPAACLPAAAGPLAAALAAQCGTVWLLDDDAASAARRGELESCWRGPALQTKAVSVPGRGGQRAMSATQGWFSGGASGEDGEGGVGSGSGSGWFADSAVGGAAGGSAWYGGVSQQPDAIPPGLEKQLADGALAGAYGGGSTVAAAPKPSGAAEQRRLPRVDMPTDQTEIDAAQSFADLSTSAAVRGFQEQLDARLPRLHTGMASICRCKERDCLLLLYGDPESEAWTAYAECKEALREVVRVENETPRHYGAGEDTVKKGFDILGGFVPGPRQTAPTSEVAAAAVVRTVLILEDVTDRDSATTTENLTVTMCFDGSIKH